MDIPCQIADSNGIATKEMDIVLQRIISFLSKAQQVNKHVLCLRCCFLQLSIDFSNLQTFVGSHNCYF